MINLAELEAQARHHLGLRTAVLLEPRAMLELVDRCRRAEGRSREPVPGDPLELAAEAEALCNEDWVEAHPIGATAIIKSLFKHLREATLTLNGIARLVGHPPEGLSLVDMVDDKIDQSTPGKSPQEELSAWRARAHELAEGWRGVAKGCGPEQAPVLRGCASDLDRMLNGLPK